ncbi:hypothetical protein Pfo_017604 [Paulownia fortunei]|nr:hypothetical protein Pfo_017604 [Paulownia fortunei]
MAVEISSAGKRKNRGFMTLLSSAACEWFLIFLLFVDTALSYLLTKFAQYCELQTPCPFCSRLDHVFGKKKKGCYWSLVCSKHKEEISSLVYCSVHGKLADVHGMCEECLTPIARQNNSESDRLLVGKLWVDVERSFFQNLMLNKSIQLGSLGCRTCSCCNKTWSAKSKAERLLELNPVWLGASKANVKPPLPHVPGHSRFSRRDSLKRLRDKFIAPMTYQPTGGNSIHTLSDVGYTKLKVSSDSESEVPLSEDDDDGNTGTSGNNYVKPDHDVEFGRRDLPKTPVNNVASEKQTHQGSEMKDQPDLLDLNEPKNVNSSSSDALMDHGLRELSWAEYYHKPSPHLTTELISLDDVPQPPDVGSLGASAETSNFSLPHTSALSALSELLSLHTVPSSSNTVTISKKPINIGGTCEKVNKSVTNYTEAAAGTSSDDTHSSESNCKNLTASLSQSTENMELSCGHEVEPINASDSSRTEEDMKSVSQVTTFEEGVLPKDTSPRPHDEHNEPRKDEDSSSQALPLSAFLKRNDSSYESLDGISVSDIEGESIVDRLRRQVEHDRSCMNSLYKELEEERNAAAIAANQAMAMITRLQEEKAALHMEALQYLRMMEEQAEYDMEALERANDLLAEKEKELQDLETELEFCRNNFPDESAKEDIRKETSVLENHVAAHCESCPVTYIDSKSAQVSKANGNCKPMSSSVSNFEDEKLYISQCLKKLEKKLRQAYSSWNLEDMPNGLISDKIKDEVGNLGDLPPNTETLLSFEIEENTLVVQNNSSASNGNPAQDTASNGTTAHDKENDYHYEKSDNLSENHGDTYSAAFEKEIAVLHDRLEALENDQDFLKHASNLLRNGKDGLQLIQDIAHQLQELRKIEFRKR